MCPQVSGCILFAPPPPPDVRAVFLHSDLLCNGRCSVVGGSITYWGHKQKRPELWVFPIIDLHENKDPHYGIIKVIGGAVGYLTTKLRGGYNGKDPEFYSKMCKKYLVQKIGCLIQKGFFPEPQLIVQINYSPNYGKHTMRAIIFRRSILERSKLSKKSKNFHSLFQTTASFALFNTKTCGSFPFVHYPASA